jgi:microcystin-dependent protein
MPVDYDEFVATFAYDKILDISATSVAFLLSASNYLLKRYAWSRNGEKLSDSEWDTIKDIADLAQAELMTGLVGMIFPHAMGTVSAFKFVPCDGGTYNKSDYPLLYDAIDPVYILSGTQFTTPDLRNRTIVGAGDSYAVNDSGGADNVILQVEHLPAHNHTTQPHNHTSPAHNHLSNYPVFGIDIESVGVPDPTGLGNPPIQNFTTSTAVTINNETVIIDDTGDDTAHENRMPYRALEYIMVAG